MKQKTFWACLILLATGFVACNSKDDTAIPDTSSNINVFIGVAGAQFDIAIDTAFIGTDVGEGESTGYKSFRAQRYTLNIYAAGNHTSPVAFGQISMRNNYHYSVFLSQARNKTLRLLAVEDVLNPPNPFTGRVRIVNLSDSYNSDQQSVNLDFSLADLKDTTRFRNLNYLAVTPFTEIQAGDYDRHINLANSSVDLLGTIVPTFTVPDGKLTSWIVYGNAYARDSFKLVEFQHN